MAPGVVTPWDGWDALEARVSGSGGGRDAAPVPPVVMADYRRAWFLSLIRQGRAADAAGRASLAAHCRARVEAELSVLAAASSSAPSSVSGAGARAASSPSSPLADLAARRGVAARARLAELLARHGDRLSAAERASFQAAVDEALGGTGAAPAGDADVRIAELRRRLVDRLLRASRYRKQGGRLAGWAARKPAAPGTMPAGPYNDYRTLEETLRRIAAARPDGAAWAAEFFDVYAGMSAVRRVYGEFLPRK
jgi:hypothetical protein